ncbi:MAG: 4-(cytidine 5'-diphospho)-2-C-methyl-D-erythritol kinase [Paenibacillaceae bacterium ZCTH02-B3]|nr:MAG: 4-(cytidine 5'-diphospho)-2-C-methyl-D-erythritol kinase [Paenibacillaceae bacterium ZCTH02-B3]
MKCHEKAPAKINLLLDVIRKREDGYHEVEMVMTMVDLADRLTLSELDGGEIRLTSSAGNIPLDGRNLVVQAAELIRQRYGVRKGVHIHLEKRIPVAAGLAGGSSDAAAALRGLNRLWRLGLSADDLRSLAAELGSDVPFCIAGGTAVARGRGELLTPIDNPLSAWVVLARPPIHVSTAAVYGRLKVDRIGRHPDLSAVLSAMARRDYRMLCGSLGNVLEDVTIRMHPEIGRLKETMLRLGADAALMSGSGPTVFGLTVRRTKAARIYNGLRGFCRDVTVVRMLPDPMPVGN